MPELGRPSAWRIATAFLVVPIAMAFMVACIQPVAHGVGLLENIARTTVIYALFGTYPVTLALAVPAYLLVRNRLRPTLFNCAGIGGMVAAVPTLLLIVFRPAEIAQSAILAGAIGIGLLAGAAFWLIAAAGFETPPSKSRL